MDSRARLFPAGLRPLHQAARPGLSHAVVRCPHKSHRPRRAPRGRRIHVCPQRPRTLRSLQLRQASSSLASQTRAGRHRDHHDPDRPLPSPRDRRRSSQSGGVIRTGPPCRLRPHRVIAALADCTTTLWWGRRGYGRDMAIDPPSPRTHLAGWSTAASASQALCRTPRLLAAGSRTRTARPAHTSPPPHRAGAGRGPRRRPCWSPQSGRRLARRRPRGRRRGVGNRRSDSNAAADCRGEDVRFVSPTYDVERGDFAVAASLVVSESWWLIELEGVGGGEAGVRVTSPASRRSPSRHHRCTRHLAPRYSCHHRPMSLQR